MDELLPALQTHLDICEEANRIALEENRLLMQTAQPPDDAFLSKKKSVLARLSDSLDAVRSQRALQTQDLTRQHRQLMEKAQQIVLKTLLLDRENEQLLLKTTFGAKRPASQKMTPLSQIQKLYQRHTSPPEKW